MTFVCLEQFYEKRVAIQHHALLNQSQEKLPQEKLLSERHDDTSHELLDDITSDATYVVSKVDVTSSLAALCVECRA